MATKRIDEEVLEVLRAGYVDDGVYILVGKLERSLYVKVDKVLKALGGKWNRKLSGHAFKEDPSDMINAVCSTGEYTDWKKLYQFFPTPADLADRMVEIAAPTGMAHILEPSFGDGAIATAIERYMIANGFDDNYLLGGCEIDERHTKDIADDLFDELYTEDFLGLERNGWDAIIMNPPFTRGQDLDHVRHAYHLLAPGGIVVAITMPSWKFRQDRKFREFKDWFDSADALGHVEHDEDLEAGTFKASGTEVRTHLMAIRKGRS